MRRRSAPANPPDAPAVGAPVPHPPYSRPRLPLRAPSPADAVAPSSAPSAVAPASLALPDRGAVLLALEAAARGFRNALAFKRWCYKRGVPVMKDDKYRWVRPADVDRALQDLPVVSNTEQDDLQTAAAAAARDFAKRST